MRDDFLDSNILIYALDGREPAKREIARALVHDALTDGAAIISPSSSSSCSYRFGG